MSDVSRLLSAAQADPQAASQLLPLVYDELRQLAAQKLAQVSPGQTLQPTALVHEAYLRLVGEGHDWEGRGHFFAAAAEAMRRILVDTARGRAALKRGGGARRMALEGLEVGECRDDEVLALDEALTELEGHDAQAAALVKLRYFSGLGHQEAADALGLSRRAADRVWALAKAWLHQRLTEG